MKQVLNPVLSDAEAKKLLYNCMICGKPIEGFYGRWGNVGTCSRKCEVIQEGKPKYEPDLHGVQK